jgi:[ribosomal protein S18]-alanine N-acetyltransferase
LPLETLRQMNETDAMTIAEWQYDEKDGIHNLGNDPEDLGDFITMQRWQTGFYVAEDERGIAGFIRFGSSEDSVLEVSLGLRPDLVGKGLGFSFLSRGLDFAKNAFHPKRFRLSVAIANRRACKVYILTGFQPMRQLVRRIDGKSVDFIEMELEV